ncbi:hypothetical protein HMPREF0518_1581 [Lactobacillus helveticus DSM 20075 = CGMCC 1.1877]|nr:hypothetical protein HMPREF0518_1581 [Lactobacillus helveticus DSM 20075 = CGMCC 1.1877]
MNKRKKITLKFTIQLMKTVAILPVCELTNILICIIFLNFLKLSYNHWYSIAKMIKY